MVLIIILVSMVNGIGMFIFMSSVVIMLESVSIELIDKLMLLVMIMYVVVMFR